MLCLCAVPLCCASVLYLCALPLSYLCALSLCSVSMSYLCALSLSLPLCSTSVLCPCVLPLGFASRLFFSVLKLFLLPPTMYTFQLAFVTYHDVPGRTLSLSAMPLDTNSPLCLLVLLPDPVLTCDLLVFIHSFVVSLSASSPPTSRNCLFIALWPVLSTVHRLRKGLRNCLCDGYSILTSSVLTMVKYMLLGVKVTNPRPPDGVLRRGKIQQGNT